MWKIKEFFRKRRNMRLLVHVRYRNNQERYERVLLAPEFYTRMCQSFLCAEEVREVRVYQELYRHHKSYAEDFEIDEKFLAVLADAKPLKR